MGKYNHNKVKNLINFHQLGDEIEEAIGRRFIRNFKGQSVVGNVSINEGTVNDDVEINTDTDLTTQEETDLYAAIDNHVIDSNYDLSEDGTTGGYKKTRYAQIDARTTELQAEGFSYDTKNFPSSQSDKDYYESIKNNKTDYSFPISISTKSNNLYNLNSPNVTAFWTAWRDMNVGHYETGRDLKKQIKDAANRAAAKLIIDNR